MIHFKPLYLSVHSGTITWDLMEVYLRLHVKEYVDQASQAN